MRPSILFGPEDDFFNRFAALARMSPVLPLIGGGHTKFQPVFVGDVAKAIAEAAEDKLRTGTIYELGGPEVRTFKELMQFILATIERNRLLVPLPFFAAKLKALFLQFAPSPLTLTPDQVEMLRTDNVVSEKAVTERRTLQGIGIDAGNDRGDRAVLSLALPQDRPVQKPYRLRRRRRLPAHHKNKLGDTHAGHHQCRGPAAAAHANGFRAPCSNSPKAAPMTKSPATPTATR